MKLKEEFVLAALAPEANVAELCREHGISRKTGYKWLGRFHEAGLVGLEEMSRRPHTSPLRASGDMVLEVVALRGERPRWGPKKLRAVLLRRFAPGGSIRANQVRRSLPTGRRRSASAHRRRPSHRRAQSRASLLRHRPGSHRAG